MSGNLRDYRRYPKYPIYPVRRRGRPARRPAVPTGRPARRTRPPLARRVLRWVAGLLGAGRRRPS
ncbi:MAG TPA: hypothetical protein VFA11_19505 [Acidimicrobiales bacterium]|nr:hypothetical protein [Acidimicrobiales bacterium]